VIRLGAAVERLSVEQYGAFYAGTYRQMRNDYLKRARKTEGQVRGVLVFGAKLAHADMLRCVREARRDQLARGGV